MKARNRFSVKGSPIPEAVQPAVEAIYTQPRQIAFEAMATQAYPKYNIGPGYQVGTNRSKAIPTDEAARNGFKSQLPNIPPPAGMRLSNLGCLILDQVENELVQITGGAVTLDQILAAVQLSILNAHGNRNRHPSDRVPVHNNYQHL